MERNLKRFDLTSLLNIGGQNPLKKYVGTSALDFNFYRNLIIGILLIIVGIIFILNFSNLNIKIGISLMLIGCFLIMFFNLTKKDNKKIFSGREIFLFLTFWLFINLLIFYNINADIFFIIVILGIIIIGEFLSGYISIHSQLRYNILFYILCVIFLIIIGQRILNILNL